MIIMNKSKYDKLWDLQSQIDESLYECDGIYFEQTCEDAQTKIEDAYSGNLITKEQCEELLDAMNLETNIDWNELNETRMDR